MHGTIVHRTATITTDMITAASMLVRLTHADNASLLRALGKAEARLLTQPWAIIDGELHIASYSRPQDVNITDGVDCSCPTSRGVCYHIACWSILSAIAAVGINPVAPLPLPVVLDLDELPGSFLDGPFDAFDDDELTLTHDEYGDIIPAPAAAPAFIEVVGMPVLTKRRPQVGTPVPFRPSSRIIPNPLDADVDALFGVGRAA